MSVQSPDAGSYPSPVYVGSLAISSGPIDRRRVKAVMLVLSLIMAMLYAAKAQTENEFGPTAGNISITGSYNTAYGYIALLNNLSGAANTVYGNHALLNNTNGSANTAIGVDALLSNNSGGGNIAIGYSSGQNIVTGNNNIDIGNGGVTDESDTIRIGTTNIHAATFIAGISGVSVSSSNVVVVDTAGQLGTININSLIGQAPLAPPERKVSKVFKASLAATAQTDLTE